jgi:cellulose synthase/poly-beta-1,6-N-acetylglucosamine synthase-like glycosyltransferase
MKSVFWISFGYILYVYVGYPLVLSIAARFSQPGKKDLNWFPTVSLIIAAHNEEDVLQDKLENSLKIDYPRDRLEVIVVSDGSTDNTSTIARSFSQEGILLHEIVPRGGKTRALNLAVNTVSSDILVLSDANTMYQPDASRCSA